MNNSLVFFQLPIGTTLAHIIRYAQLFCELHELVIAKELLFICSSHKFLSPSLFNVTAEALSRYPVVDHPEEQRGNQRDIEHTKVSGWHSRTFLV